MRHDLIGKDKDAIIYHIDSVNQQEFFNWI